MDQVKIGAFLKELRNHNNLTQEQIAEKLGVSQRSVSRWENGNTMPDISVLIELADYYEVDLREILNGERKMEIMTEDLKETLEMVADYTDTEKEKILNKTLKYAVGAMICAAIALVFVIISNFSTYGVWKNFVDILEVVETICVLTIISNCLIIREMMNKKRKTK